MESHPLTVRPYTFDELCDLFAISSFALEKWLAPHVAEIGRPEEKNKFMEQQFSERQVRMIFKNLIPKR